MKELDRCKETGNWKLLSSPLPSRSLQWYMPENKIWQTRLPMLNTIGIFGLGDDIKVRLSGSQESESATTSVQFIRLGDNQIGLESGRTWTINPLTIGAIPETKVSVFSPDVHTKTIGRSVGRRFSSRPKDCPPEKFIVDCSLPQRSLLLRTVLFPYNWLQSFILRQTRSQE